MTDSIVIAESIGWTEVWSEGEKIMGFTPYPVPNYPSDLNAIIPLLPESV